MRHKSIEKRKKKLNTMRAELISSQLNAVRELLPNEVIEDLCQEAGYYFRSRLLCPLVTIFHMIGAAISREGSFQSSWHLNGQTGSSGSLAKARKRLPESIWQGLDHWICDQIDQKHDSKYLWHGHRVIGLDGTCNSMSDEPELVEYFGRADSRHGPSRFPIARSVIAFNLNTLITVDYQMGPYRSSERALASQLIPRLRPGDVIVDDRGFMGIPHYHQCLEQGLHFVNRVLSSVQIDRLEVIQSFNSKDRIVKMPVLKHYLKQNPQWPEYLLLRLVQVTAPIRGRKETFWLATSLLDPKTYPASEIRMLYKKRWRAEELLRELKIWLSADVLRSQSVVQIRKEMSARIVASNLIHWLILEAAKKHRKDPKRLSMAASLRLTAAHSLKMSTAPAWQLPILFEQLLDRIASSKVPYRPNRIEPRMTKRKPKDYPTLKISRSKWRPLYAVTA
jgi:IS4 transposase